MKSPQTEQIKILLTLDVVSKELLPSDFIDIVAGRIYSTALVEDVTATEVDWYEGQKKVFNLDESIIEFNEMYRLPCPDSPTLDADSLPLRERLNNFRNILKEEISEVDDIMMTAYSSDADALTDIADWLGDIIIYCASELRKYGLPSDLILSIIMASNKSKLGIDGRPLIRKDGKVMKGPNYWPPEEQIKRAIGRSSYRGFWCLDAAASAAKEHLRNDTKPGETAS